MRRYTTPTIEVTVEGVDLTGCEIWVTLWQQGTEVTTRSGANDVAYDGSDTTITVAYSQEQTARLVEGHARMQVNWMDSDGLRNATDSAVVQVTGNLLGRVVDHA